MNLKKKLTVLLMAVLTLNASANNDVNGQWDPNEIRLIKDGRRLPDVAYQKQLREQPVWQHFLMQHGNWYVIFNEANGMPHNAFGKPIAVPLGSPETMAGDFIQNELGGFGLPMNELVLRNVVAGKDAYHVFFSQRHDGYNVLFAQLQVKLTLDGKVIGFSTDVYDNMDTEPVQITDSEASTAAVQGLDGNVTGIDVSEGQMILPIPEYRRKRTVFRMVYEIMVKTLDEAGVPSHYLTYVDAATGDVLMRKDMVEHFEDELPGGIQAVITDDVSLTNPNDAETNSTLANIEVTQGSSTFNADGSGEVIGLVSGPITVKLRGLWSEVFTNGITPEFSGNIINGLNTLDFGVNANSRESSAYYHVNIVHDYMKTKFPGFTSMDNALPTNVDVSGTCNAFYDGSSINFYQSGAGCNSFALIGDVVYHEYGHGINDKYYQSQGGTWLNGAMGEGYADVWALGITQTPILGIGNSQSLPTDYIRRYDIDPKVYPQDLVGEVHADGEIIAGAWWDLGQNFNDIQQMMDLYAATFNGLVTGLDGDEGQVYVDILVEALQVDDAPSNGGDNDITNGTPNDLDIINAFDAHGITLLSNATLSHVPIEAHDDQSIDRVC